MRLLIPILALFLAACVPRGVHELTEVQLDATRTALQDRNTQCLEESQARDTRIQSLEEELAECHVTLEATRVDRNALEEEAIRYREELATVLAALPPVEEEGAEEEPPPKPRSRRCPPCPEPPKPDPEELAHARGEMAAGLALLTDLRVENRVMDAFEADVRQRLAEPLEQDRVHIERSGGHVVVRIPSEQLFNEGRVTLSPRGRGLVESLSTGLAPARGWRIILVGHTDDTPRHSARYASNWELGFGEATLLMRELADRGVKAEWRVASAAGTEPLDPTDTPEARRTNHRVEMRLRPPPGAEPPPVEPEEVPAMHVPAPQPECPPDQECPAQELEAPEIPQNIPGAVRVKPAE